MLPELLMTLGAALRDPTVLQEIEKSLDREVAVPFFTSIATMGYAIGGEAAKIVVYMDLVLSPELAKEIAINVKNNTVMTQELSNVEIDPATAN